MGKEIFPSSYKRRQILLTMPEQNTGPILEWVLLEWLGQASSVNRVF
jgi:hypothetical protein